MRGRKMGFVCALTCIGLLTSCAKASVHNTAPIAPDELGFQYSLSPEQEAMEGLRLHSDGTAFHEVYLEMMKKVSGKNNIDNADVLPVGYLVDKLNNGKTVVSVYWLSCVIYTPCVGVEVVQKDDEKPKFFPYTNSDFIQSYGRYLKSMAVICDDAPQGQVSMVCVSGKTFNVLLGEIKWKKDEK